MKLVSYSSTSTIYCRKLVNSVKGLNIGLITQTLGIVLFYDYLKRSVQTSL